MKFRQNVAALVRCKDEYLICLRKDYNTWQSIQGGIESFDLSPAKALAREIYEELGVKEGDFTIVYQSVFWRRYLFTASTRHRHRKNLGQEQLWFLVELKNKEVLNFDVIKLEFSKTEWVSLPELLKRYADWKKSVIFDFCREIGYHQN